MEVVYVAGPFRAKTAWGIEQNVRLAEAAALAIWKAGAAAVCPHAAGRFYDGEANDEVFLEGTLELMRRCDAVVVVGDFCGSLGTLAEIAEAKRLKIPVFFNGSQTESVFDWIEGDA